FVNKKPRYRNQRAGPENHYRGPALWALQALRAGAAGRRQFRGVFSYPPETGRPRWASRPRILNLPAQPKLPAQPELLDQCPVAADVLAGQVLQQAPAATHEQQQAAAAVMVVLVDLEMLGQVVDPPAQQRDLDLRRAGVTLCGRVLGDDLVLHLGVERHVA